MAAIDCNFISIFSFFQFYMGVNKGYKQFIINWPVIAGLFIITEFTENNMRGLYWLQCETPHVVCQHQINYEIWHNIINNPLLNFCEKREKNQAWVL